MLTKRKSNSLSDLLITLDTEGLSEKEKGNISNQLAIRVLGITSDKCLVENLLASEKAKIKIRGNV